MELLVDVEDGLDEVIASVEIGNRTARIAKGFCVDDDGLAGREAFYIDAEALRGFVGFFELHARLGFVVLREDEDEMAVEWMGRGDGNLDALGEGEPGWKDA